MELDAIIVTIIGIVLASIIGLWQVYPTYKSNQKKLPSKPSATRLIESVTLKDKAEFTRLKVITDPRFIDSVIFMWILYNQPFEALGIRCELIKTDWRSVPEQVSSHRHAIGFNNRRALLRHQNKPLYDVRVWNDLCLYKGYALIARKDAKLQSPVSINAANKYIRNLVQQRGGENRKPILVCMGADSIWKIITPLTPELKFEEFDIQTFNNPDLALNKFLDGYGDFFVGGLPQRLISREHNCIEVLNFQNNPLLFSVNSLICSDEIFQKEKAILALVTSLWFDTIYKLKRDKGFCNKVAVECIQLIDELGISENSLRKNFFNQVFIDEINYYECFPDQPSGIINEMLEIQHNILEQISSTNIRKIAIYKILEQIKETLTPELDREKYPLI